MGNPALVRVEPDGDVVTITLDSPANRNALSAGLIAELGAAIDAAAADGSVRAIVLTGAGPAFCAGADLADPPGNDPDLPFGLPALLRGIADCPLPVICRVNGHVRAGGLGLVAACDLAVAPDHATFAFSEVRVGVAPAVIAVVCQPVMTPRAYRRYTLTGTTFSAAEAAECGLITLVAAPADLDGCVDELLAKLRLGAASAIARTKAIAAALPTMTLDERWRHTAEVSATQFQADDAVEGIAAFREQRPPRWAR